VNIPVVLTLHVIAGISTTWYTSCMDTQTKIEDIKPAEVPVRGEEEKIKLDNIEKEVKDAMKKGGPSALDDLHTDLVKRAEKLQKQE